MSSIFRSLAALTETLSQAMAFAGVMVLAILNYPGFTLPRPVLVEELVRTSVPVYFFGLQDMFCEHLFGSFLPNEFPAWCPSLYISYSSASYLEVVIPILSRIS